VRGLLMGNPYREHQRRASIYSSDSRKPNPLRLNHGRLDLRLAITASGSATGPRVTALGMMG
jgi:hypothetical protein